MKKEVNYGTKETFCILNKIQNLIKITPDENLLEYQIEFFDRDNNKKEIKSIKEYEILYDIQQWGGFKIHSLDSIENKNIYYLKILPKFEKIYIDHKNLLSKEKRNNIPTNIEANKKYSDANEDILLKLGIKIKGNYIIRGIDKVKINITDKNLIYYLFYKSIKNDDECFTLKDLSEAKEIKKTERYIKNRITFINQSIREIISKNVKVKIGRFILKEKNKRGYQLNPKILPIKTKKV